MKMETLPVLFGANLSQLAGVLHLDYFVENRGREAMFVRVRGGLGRESLRRPYSLLRANPSRLFLSYQVFPIPPLVEVYVPVIPPACRIEAGQRYEDFAELELPVKERHPYAELDYPSNPEPVQLQDIEFATEYLWQADITSRSEYRPEQGLFIVVGKRSQSLSATLQAQESVNVLRREDEFFRY
jgi:hypothetical protein